MVETRTPKPDCVPCTEAKQTEEPFNNTSHNQGTKPGELTHIDLWGKYHVKSINGNQYYIAFIDDAGWFTTIRSLKAKSEVVQKVKIYLTHLEIQGKTPQVVHFDCGKEILDEELESWCAEQEIEIQAMALYSPSQNGIT